MNIRMICFAILCIFSFINILAQDYNTKLWYRQPAKRFEEALPMGNGRIGLMVYGDI